MLIWYRVGVSKCPSTLAKPSLGAAGALPASYSQNSCQTPTQNNLAADLLVVAFLGAAWTSVLPFLLGPYCYPPPPRQMCHCLAGWVTCGQAVLSQFISVFLSSAMGQ